MAGADASSVRPRFSLINRESSVVIIVIRAQPYVSKGKLAGMVGLECRCGNGLSLGRLGLSCEKCQCLLSKTAMKSFHLQVTASHLDRI